MAGYSPISDILSFGKSKKYSDKIMSNIINIPNATSENDGLLSKEDYNKLNNLDNIYVQKDNNKTLSSNDYTNIDKNKVNNIVINGEGNKFLSDSGNYIEIKSENNIIEEEEW